MLRFPLKQNVMTSQAATSTTQANIVSVPVNLDSDLDAIVFQLTCSQASGTLPTLDIFVQTTPDGGVTWYDMIQFPRVTASAAASYYAVVENQGMRVPSAIAGSSTLASTGGGTGVPLLSPLVKVSATIGGTNPQFTFAVTALEAQANRGGI